MSKDGARNMKPDNQHWSTMEERGSVLGMRILLSVYRVLGRYILWIFLFPVVFYFYLSGKKQRTASFEFLTRVNQVLGRKQKVSQRSILKHFCCFADSAFDKIDAWVGKLTPDMVKYEPENKMKEIVERGRGAVFIGSHLGNLEVCRALSRGRYQAKINVLVFTENAVKFNQVLSQVCPDINLDMIQLKDIGPDLAISLKGKVDNGEIVVIVGDRTSVSVAGRVVYKPFLGQKAPFSQGPFILATLLDCPVYWLFCLKQGKHFRVVFEYVADTLKVARKERQQALDSVIGQYAQRLEHYTLQAPYQWFNFYNFWQQDNSAVRASEMEGSK